MSIVDFIAVVSFGLTSFGLGYSFGKDDTLLIFDEIQEYPDIATSLKSFKVDGKYDVICSGSLLGIHYQKIHSNSVGYKTDYEMYSMDFEEYCRNQIHYQKMICHNMISCFPHDFQEFNVLQIRINHFYCK